MTLNFFVDGFDIYTLINEYGVKIKRSEENILVSFSNKMPTHFEIDYFFIESRKVHTHELKFIQEMRESARNISSRFIEMTLPIQEKLKR